jgi:4-hydroxyproline epimerase
VALSDGPELGKGPLAERLTRFRAHHDEFRSAVIHEPRGSDPMVGALQLEPADYSCDFGVIFFNNVGYLGMCGHGTIGLIHMLAQLGRIGEGSYRVETPVGTVRACREASGVWAIENVPAWRSARGVVLDVDGSRRVVSDVAWGVNWFFLSESTAIPLQLNCIGALTACAQAIRASLQRAGVTGDNGEEIDHIELCGAAANAACDSRNFVLCPGGAHDRSPCGTGTSAHMACLYAEGELAPSTNWRQLAQEHDTLRAVKESSTDVRRVTAIRVLAGERIRLFVGRG